MDPNISTQPVQPETPVAQSVNETPPSSHKSKLILIVLALIILIIVGAGGYYMGTKKETTQQPKVASPTFAPTAILSPTLAITPSEAPTSDVKKIKPGDIIAGMTVVSVHPASDNIGPTPPNFPLSNDNVEIDFKGNLTLNVNYEYSKQDPGGFFGGKEHLIFSFNANDNPSMKPLSTNFENDRNIWIENLTNAKQMLEIKESDELKSGQVKVIMDNYKMINYPSEVSDFGTLVKLIN